MRANIHPLSTIIHLHPLSYRWKSYQQSVERRQAIALQLSNEAYEESLRRLRAQVNRGAKLGRMPSSCRDLWTIGHSHTGYYIVKSNNIKHPIEILYCDMADRGNASSSSALQRDCT
jgi:hypothetical protein